MIQVQLNLPKLTNKGKSNKRYLNQLEVEACKNFGGLTTFNRIPFIFKFRILIFKIFNVKNGRGSWLYKAKLYNDNIKIYQIAIEPSKKKLFIKLCKKYGKLTKQLAIYVVINNKARIIQL